MIYSTGLWIPNISEFGGVEYTVVGDINFKTEYAVTDRSIDLP